MRKFINIVERYTENNSYLARYLKSGENGHDPHEYWYLVRYAIEHGDFTDIAEAIQELYPDATFEDISEMDSDILNELDPNLVKEFAEEAHDFAMRHFPEEAPSQSFFTLNQDKLLPRQTWLIHFSDHVHDIVRKGFTHGVEDVDRLGLTTHFTHDSKSSGGYNFAFVANDFHADKSNYGKHAVMFQNSGVIAHHSGDAEDQVIFWGADVDPRGIIPLFNRDGNWTIELINDRSIPFDSLSDAMGWVMKNHHQYRKMFRR